MPIVNTDEAPHCERCAAPLSGQAVGGLCANCLLQLALDPPAEPPAAPGEFADESAEEPVAPGETAGARIGRYRLLEQIGQGGFGTVWMAEQNEPVQRRVALKIIRIGMDTREFIARFEQERQALAMMDHPNIAKVFDAGATDSGRPFFVMELVSGVPITKFCDEQKLPLAARLELFVEVCRAIQHAHQKGIIHRDIKPTNIMVALDGDKALPKVIDFGIAKAVQGKLSDETVVTRFEQFIGTPVYMSPEQAGMVPDIDTRSDIYALGVLLYELLTGKPAFDAKSLVVAGHEEMRRIIREVDPPKPSSKLGSLSAGERTTLANARQIEPSKIPRMIESDLDWIVMKAIDKDRARRYETVNGLARDIQRFLASEPVSATPPSTAYKFRKFARRNKAILSMVATIAAVLVAATIVSLWHAARATNAEETATAKTADEKVAREDAEAVSVFLTEIFQSPDPALDGHKITVSEVLARAVTKVDADLSGQPARQRQLRLALGKTYSGLGLYAEAIPLLEKVRDYDLATWGPTHPTTLETITILAGFYSYANRRQEALEMRKEVLELRRKVLGPEHPDTLAAMYNLILSWYDTGRWKDAAELREEALALDRKLAAASGVESLVYKRFLADHLGELGAGSDGDNIRKREAAVAQARGESEKDHPAVFWTQVELAQALSEGGRKDEALKLRQELLAMSRKLNPPNHPDILFAIYLLAQSLFDTGQPAEALKLREEVVALDRKHLPQDHKYTLWAMADLAKSYNAMNRRDDARKLLEEVLEVRRKTDGPAGPYLLRAMHEVVVAYGEANRLAEQLKLCEEMLTIRRAAFPAEEPNTLAAMTYVASCYRVAGRLDDAIALQEPALAAIRRTLRADHPFLIDALTNMAVCYEFKGKKEEALQLREERARIQNTKGK